MGAIKERHEPQTEPGVVVLNADAVLYSLDNDCTLNQLDAAHRELDARARAMPAHGLADPAPIAALRRTVEAQHRLEVGNYAQQLKMALRYQLCVRSLKYEVNVATSDVAGFVQFTPLALPPEAMSPVSSQPSSSNRPVDRAIADAIALTPTPGILPGTLLSRAEAACGR